MRHTTQSIYQAITRMSLGNCKIENVILVGLKKGFLEHGMRCSTLTSHAATKY